MKAVRYVGLSDAKIVKAEDFTANGLPGTGTQQWDRDNNYEILLGDAAAAFLLAQGDFEEASGLDFGDLFGSAGISGKRVFSTGSTIDHPTTTVSDIPGMSGTWVKEVGGPDLAVLFGGHLLHDTVGKQVKFQLSRRFEGGAWAVIEEHGMTNPVANGLIPASKVWDSLVPLAAGIYDFKLGIICHFGAAGHGTAHAFGSAAFPTRMIGVEL